MDRSLLSIRVDPSILDFHHVVLFLVLLLLCCCIRTNSFRARVTVLLICYRYYGRGPLDPPPPLSVRMPVCLFLVNYSALYGTAGRHGYAIVGTIKRTDGREPSFAVGMIWFLIYYDYDGTNEYLSSSSPLPLPCACALLVDSRRHDTAARRGYDIVETLTTVDGYDYRRV